jgi:putative thioredoxin
MPSIPHARGAVDLSSLVRPARSSTPTGGQAPGGAGASSQVPTVPVPNLVLDGTDANFSAVLDLSAQVPVLVDLWAANNPVSAQVSALLESVVLGLAGRFVLVRVEAGVNPQLAQGFQTTSVPTTAAVLAGQAVPLFSGTITQPELLGLLEQVLALAAKNGVTAMAVPADGAPLPEAAEPALPPHLLAAFDAAEKGDYAAAIEIYQDALRQNPADYEAKAGLAQMSLLARLQHKTMAEIRARAASEPTNLEAQLDVADLDVSGGHVDDAFDRLLTVFPTLDQAGKNLVRTRLLELFDVVGLDTPAVIRARGRLTNLLY